MRGRGDEPGDRLRSTPSLRRVHGSLLIRLADLHRQHPVDEIARRFRPGREALHQVFVGVEVPAEVVGVCRRLERDAGGRKRLHRLAPHVQEFEQLPRRTMRLRKLRIGQDSAQELASPLERLRISVAVRTAHRAPANRGARRQVAAPRLPRRRGIASDGTECGLRFSQLTGIETCRGDLIIAVGSRDRGASALSAAGIAAGWFAGLPQFENTSSWARTQSRNRGSVAPSDARRASSVFAAVSRAESLQFTM